jgi:hypothetical protein
MWLWPANWRTEFALEHLIYWIKASDLTYPIRIRFVSLFRNKAYQFPIGNRCTMVPRQLLDGGMHLANRSSSKIGNIHADLRAAVGYEAESFDAVQSAGGGPDIPGDGAGNGYVGVIEMNVVGDEETTCTDGTGSGGLVQFRATYIGLPGGVFPSRIEQTFKLAATNILEQNAVGASGGSTIKVDWDTITPPDLKASLSRKHGALGERDAADGNEWNDVGSPDARMNTLLTSQIDELCSLADCTDSSLYYCFGSPRDGYDRTVMGCIERPIQKTNAFDLHRRDYLRDDFYAGSFREIGDTFDDGVWIHVRSRADYFHQL